MRLAMRTLARTVTPRSLSPSVLTPQLSIQGISSISAGGMRPGYSKRDPIWTVNQPLGRMHSCAGGLRLTEDGYLHKSIIPTLHFQNTLPTIDIPPLEETLSKYLDAVRPLVSDEAFERTQGMVESFGTNEGPQLQAELEASREGTYGSYIAEPWLRMYLEYRESMMINMNPQLTLKKDPAKQNQADRATSLVVSIVRFYRTYRDGHLSPDIFYLGDGLAKKDWFKRLLCWTPKSLTFKLAYLGKAVPLDMGPYRYMFNSSRIPGPGVDRLEVNAAEARHIVVQYGHAFYTVQVLNEDGTAIPPERVQASIESILQQPAVRDPKTAPPVGVLTSLPRDDWAVARTTLTDDPLNAATLRDIETALFALCLEDDAPEDLFDELMELSAAEGIGIRDAVARMGRSDVDPYGPLKCFLHGRDATNRWFDKSFQLIVDGNANAAVNFEHTWGDGISILRMCDEVFRDACASPTVHAHTDHLSTDTRALEWGSLESVQATIDDAAARARSAIDSLEYGAAISTALGGTRIKELGLSPDGVLQMSLQLAYYRLLERSPSTYEAATTAYFKDGRTETIRSASVESDRMCKVFMDTDSSPEQRRAALEAAVDVHSKRKSAAQVGKGHDRHLFVLADLAKQKGLEIPMFVDDPSYQVASTIVLSTSTLPASPALDKGGFGPVSPECFAVGYGVKPDSCHVSVTSFHKGSGEFAEAVEWALTQVRNAYQGMDGAPKSSSSSSSS